MTQTHKSVTCPLCSHTFTPSGLACHSHCPLGSRCNLICCPQCGYQLIDESRSRTAGWLRRLLPAGKPAAAGATAVRPSAINGALPLTHIPVGMTVEVCAFESVGAEQLSRFTAFGLTPGTRIELVQRHPAPVLRIGETELAVSREIVEHIWVQPGPPA
jgi:Fe2+ transport system protein FeoA